MKRILHLANWNSTNIGNGALIYGTERVLQEDAPYPIEFVPEAWDDYTFKLKHFDREFVRLVNERSDALLINGAVTFNAFRRSMTETGMRFNLPMDLWEEIRKPIIFYGVSYRCWPEQAYPNAVAFKRMLEYALARDSIFFGVRNDGTKEWLKARFGVVSDRIREVPDPGIFVSVADAEYPELHPTRKNVMLAFNNEDAAYRFATPLEKAAFRAGRQIKDPTRLERFLTRFGTYPLARRELVRKLAGAVQRISTEIDAQFILVPHYLDDYDMLDEFINIVHERIAHQRIVSTGLLAVPHTRFFYGRYAKADLAISMRVHSMSPAIGMGTPVIPVASQGRMSRFLEKAGLSDISLDIGAGDLEERLSEKAIALLMDPTLESEMRKGSVDRMRAQARALNAEVFDLVARGR